MWSWWSCRRVFAARRRRSEFFRSGVGLGEVCASRGSGAVVLMSVAAPWNRNGRRIVGPSNYGALARLDRNFFSGGRRMYYAVVDGPDSDPARVLLQPEGVSLSARWVPERTSPFQATVS
jgi:hypothetical protein